MDLAILLSPSSDASHIRACLESLARTLPPRLVHETIFFEPPGWTPLSGAPLRVLPSDPTRGLAAARNAAVAASRAPLLCFLSPGTTLFPNWFPPMLTLLRRTADAGCIGNVQREAYSGLIDQAGLRFAAAGLPVAFAHSQTLPPREPAARHPALSFACCLVTRALFDRLHGFDETYQGPLGDVDFCLRAATLGYRHSVANGSVVYHDVAADAADPAPAADLVLYRARWGERARAAFARRAALRSSLGTSTYSREGWEMAREMRRLQREAARDTRRDGFVYLRRYLYRPWRYHYARLCQALAEAFPPLPGPLPLAPGKPFHDTVDLTRPDDGWLFDPPPR